MPDWFYPLMLIVILAGYVFLFLQGRMVRRVQDEIVNRMGRLENAMRELSARNEAAALPAVPAPAAVPAPEPEEIEARLEPRFREVLQAIGAQGEALDAVRQAAESTQQALHAATRPEAQDLSPEEVARRFLLEEGFSRIHVTGSDVREGGTRFIVRAMRGDEVRSGFVLVKGAAVVDASMKAPSALFP